MKAKSLFVVLFMMFAAQAWAGDVAYYFWQGKIRTNKVKMACAVKDGIMTGELFESSDGETIILNVAGYENNGMFDVCIYDDSYGVAYNYFLRAEVKNGELVGISQPEGKKFRLKKYEDKYASPINREPGIYSSPYVDGKTFSFSGWDNGGMYKYENAMGVCGELTLWGNMNDDTFALTINRDSDPDGGGNDATVNATGLTLPDGGDFDYTMPYGNYSFSVRFYNHFLVIRTLSGTPASCFGAGAAITGIYIMFPAKG